MVVLHDKITLLLNIKCWSYFVDLSARFGILGVTHIATVPYKRVTYKEKSVFLGIFWDRNKDKYEVAIFTSHYTN